MESVFKKAEMGMEKYKRVTMKKLFILLKNFRATILKKKEAPSVLFVVRHMFELFDTNHIVSWLPRKLVLLSSE